MDAILIEGPSGTGKTYGWRNVPVNESVIITPNSKSMSFGNTKAYYDSKVKIKDKEYSRIMKTDKLEELPGLIRLLARAGVKYILLEDFTHYFTAMIVSDDFMKQGSGNSSFERWKQFALKVYKVIKAGDEIKHGEPGFDCTLVIHHHVDFSEKLGIQAFKIFGKLLSDNIDPVSYFTVVLHSIVVNGKRGEEKHRYLVNNDGMREAKCPPEITALLGTVDEADTIPNDTYPVLKALRKFNGYEDDDMPL